MNYWSDYTPRWSYGSLPARNAALMRQVFKAVYDDCFAAFQPCVAENKTFCNRMVQEATKACGCPIPRVVQVNDEWKEQGALKMYQWLAGPGIDHHGWKRLADMQEARRQAAAGFPVVICYPDYVGRESHIAMGLDTPDEEPLIRIVQAGASVLWDVPISHGFGPFTPMVKFFVR
jgi:hypothetical protein